MVRRSKPVHHAVPRLWPNSTVVCIASGPSLTQSDVDYCRDKARVIVVNNNWELAPWADALYACDASWWKWYPAAASFKGLKFTLCQPQMKISDLHVLRNTGREGLELDPTGVKTGANSGYQAINLAVHLGANRIILLGYDLQQQGGKHHHHLDHPHRSSPPYVAWLGYFQTLAPALKKHGVEVVNCSRRTALTCFARQPLSQALPAALELAS